MVLPELNLARMSERIRKAKENNARDLYLPELKPDAAWVLSRVDEIAESAMAWAIKLSSGTRDTRDVYDNVYDSTDLERNSDIIRRHAQALKNELQSLLKDPRGIHYRKWYFLARSFTRLASIPSADAFNYLWYLSDLHQDMLRMTASHPMDEFTLKESDWKNNEWVKIPSVRELPHPSFNRWQEAGLAPVAVVDKYVEYDGASSKQSPYFYFSHDERHTGEYAKQETRLLTMGFREYQRSFRTALESSVPRGMLKDTIEGLWHFIYHEGIITIPEITDYSPIKLLQLLRHENYAQNHSFDLPRIDLQFQRRLRPRDLGNFFIRNYGAYPTLSVIHEAMAWLDRTASGLLIKDVRARIEKRRDALRQSHSGLDLSVLGNILASLTEEQAIIIQAAIEIGVLVKPISRRLHDAFKDKHVVDTVIKAIWHHNYDNNP